MCKILSRIKIIAETEGISIGAIERTIGASRGVISKAIAKGTDIQSKWLELICERFPKYSPLWLLTGQGEMYQRVLTSPNADEVNEDDEPSEKIIEESLRKISPDPLKDAMIERFLMQIKDLAEEIGRLKERIKQLEHEKNMAAKSFLPARQEVPISQDD